MEIKDFSGRRGVLVPIFPKIHAMLKENSEKDRISGLKPPEHVITWQQKMRSTLVDNNRRFFVAMDGNNLAGIFFYRYDGNKIYIEDVHVAWAYRRNALVIDGFLKKLEYDQGTKDATFFVGERIKLEVDKEILASKGFKDEHEDGWERLGTLQEAIAALKIRYNRGA
ncbi:MAG: hypothetical protein FWF81_13945 [Defluviitaleaceae bacterium]|nr:hypothetical protein [Defluviitaleaceae bacterium]